MFQSLVGPNQQGKAFTPLLIELSHGYEGAMYFNKKCSRISKNPSFLHLNPSTSRSGSRNSHDTSPFCLGGWSFWLKNKKDDTIPQVPQTPLTFTGGCLVGASYVFLASVLKHKRSIIWSNFELIVVKSWSNWPSLWINLQDDVFFFVCVCFLFWLLDLWVFSFGSVWFERFVCFFFKSQFFNFVGDK